MPHSHLVEPGSHIDLSTVPTGASSYHDDRDAAEKELRKLRRELADLQHLLYAEGRHKVLIVFQAMDAGGKDGTIRRVFKGVNPQGVRVTSFKVPSKEERAHDFLWRVHKAAPAAGMIEVFNRSHYEDVLVVRVDRLVPESVWQARFAQINAFEELLSAAGTTVLKFYLHISKDEQKERFQARVDTPEKQWKFSLGDLKKRKQWAEYETAYEDVLSRCSTEHAPWWIVPSDQKWYRNLAIARILVERLRSLDMEFPKPEEALAPIEIE